MAWQKMRRMARVKKTSLDSFANINDIISFRLVLKENNEECCYSLLPAINRFLGPYLDQNRFDDYIACPQNGYRAIQVTAWLPDYGAVEVAITTQEMEDENHWGVIHAIRTGKDLSAYRPMVVLTPTSGVRFVPDGSTVLDAVASIQQEFLLDKISSVNVNGGLARLADKVKPGDVIEVVTGENRIKPSEDWLNYCNEQTARLLRDVLVTDALKKSAEQGRVLIKSVLAGRGIFLLEDLQILEKDRFDNILERLACVNLEDLYSAIGGGAVRLHDFARTLDELGVTKEDLQWTTINILGTSQSNKPGTLVKLAGVVSHMGANIIRSINDTLPDGSFSMRLVLKHLPPENIEKMILAYQNGKIELNSLEVL
jgi:guanosine-3',5'-bis(diphosphate) 3'-pyrophosphohydrolase